MNTPYAAAKFVNNELAKAGLTKRIPPQMMYNYTKGRISQGKKPFIAFDEKNGVDQKALVEWTKGYVSRQLEKSTPIVSDPEQFEFDSSEAN